jgi:ATP-dependent 26S proteasome regulatory subunit
MNQHEDQARTVNQLLEEISELSEQNHQVVVIGATNRPDKLNPAMLRSGRLSNKIEIGMPDASTRIAVLQFHLEAPTADDLFERSEIGYLSEGLSNADMARLAEEAARLAMYRDDVARPRDLENALVEMTD